MSKSFETSEAIVAGIVEGDRLAEKAMVEKYRKPLVFIIERRTNNRENAKDILQDTFLIVLQKLRTEPLKDPSKLGAYLQRTAINLHIGEVRKSIRRNTTTDSELIDAYAESEGDQHQKLVDERAKIAVKKLLSELHNERDRNILTLYYIQEGEKDAICEELELSLRHFDRVISRARSRFKELMDGRQDEIPLEMSS